MSDKLQYNLSISIKKGSDISEVEDELEDLLIELYQNDNITEITVSDRTPPIDEDMDELLRVIDDIENSDIRQSIEFVRALGELS